MAYITSWPAKTHTTLTRELLNLVFSILSPISMSSYRTFVFSITLQATKENHSLVITPCFWLKVVLGVSYFMIQLIPDFMPHDIHADLSQHLILAFLNYIYKTWIYYQKLLFLSNLMCIFSSIFVHMSTYRMYTIGFFRVVAHF